MSVGFWRTFLFDITTQNNLLFQSHFSMKNPFNNPENVLSKKIQEDNFEFSSVFGLIQSRNCSVKVSKLLQVERK